MLLDGGVQGLVDVLHDPVEEPGIDVLGQGIPGVHHLLHRHALHVGLRRGDELAMAKPVLHLAVLHSQQAAEIVQVLILALGVMRSKVSRLVSLQNGSFNTEFPDQCKKLTAFRNYLGKYRVSLWLIGNRKAMSTHPVALVFTDMDETAHMEL